MVLQRYLAGTEMRASHGTLPLLFLQSMTNRENKQVSVIMLIAIFMEPHSPIVFTHVLAPLLD